MLFPLASQDQVLLVCVLAMATMKHKILMRSVTLLSIAIASSIGWFPCSELRAEPGYKSKSGKIAFHVDTNVPFLKVSGSSSGVKGGGEASVAGDIAAIRNLRFEVDPKTF